MSIREVVNINYKARSRGDCLVGRGLNRVIEQVEHTPRCLSKPELGCGIVFVIVGMMPTVTLVERF